jgi:hypothetical protein
MTPPSSQTHYQTSFHLKAMSGFGGKLITEVAEMVRNWIGEKEKTRDAHFERCFLSGGKWRSNSRPQRTVEVVLSGTQEGDQSPELWALHYCHPEDDKCRHRLWYSDIGLRMIAKDEVVFGLRVSHAMDRGFIGVAPQLPRPSAPRLVEDLFRSPKWTIHSAGSQLVHEPIEIGLGKGESLVNSIFDKARTVPIVLVSGRFNEQEFPINAHLLQKLLIGNAVVCWCDYNPEAAEELHYFLPSNYRCAHQMVRVFMPGADKEDPSDYRRHRFFSSSDIQRESVSAVLEAIVSALARRVRENARQAITSIADIENLVRERKLATYRNEGMPSVEWISLLEEENRSLTAEKTIASQLDEVDAVNNRLAFDNQNLKANLDNQKASKAGSYSVTPEDRQALARVLDRTMRDAKPADCLRTLVIIHPERVRLLPSAINSAEDSAAFQDIKGLWELLLKLATGYYSAMNSGGAGDSVARRVFGKSEYSAKESESVESSPRLLGYRQFHDGEITRTMLRHLKIGVKDSKAETIRVHFDWDATSKKVVIGHCGPHLPLS